MPLKAFELTIRSSLDELDAVRSLVCRVVQEYKLGDDLAYWLELSVTESMINAIRHGNQFDPTKKARLRISSNGAILEVIVEDQVPGFRLEELADPTTRQSFFPNPSRPP